MELRDPQSYVLYLLGLLFDEFEKQKQSPLLELRISKSQFITIARRAQLVNKQERALYKNLEKLEADKLISYEQSSLRLTTQGERVWKDLLAVIRPYVRVTVTVAAEQLLRYSSKVQTKFSGKSK